MTSKSIERHVEEIAASHSIEELIAAIKVTSQEPVYALAAVVTKLERRKRDVEDLLSITKSLAELTRKLERLTERLAGEQETKA